MKEVFDAVIKICNQRGMGGTSTYILAGIMSVVAFAVAVALYIFIFP